MENTVTAALAIIGDEILSGRTLDKNTQFLATSLGNLGIALREVRVIPDDEETIITTVNYLRGAYRYVFTTGGIGPTHDDITSAAIAKAFNLPLTAHPEALRRLETYYAGRDIEFNAARRKMAYMPEGACLIDNPVSIAPGFRIGNLFVMAGVPSIMQAMFAEIIPHLQGGALTLSKTLTIALPEGAIAAEFEALQKRYPAIAMGSYPIMKEKPCTSLVLRGTDSRRLEAAFAELKRFITSLEGEIIAEE